jgi:lipid II:glycine glycyltransferase (peptidoglycan interpeptide bridge formation enzyme)
MKVIELDKKWKDAWNEIAKGPKGSFLQSYEWGEFKEVSGHKVWRFAITQTELRSSDLTSSFKILAIASVVKEEVPYLGSYLYVPHGPIFNTEDKEKVMVLLQKELENLAQKEEAMFVRFEPKNSLDFSENLTHYKSSIQAIYTLKVNLSPELDDIMNSFKKDTRYSIRTAQKRGVSIEIGEERDVAKFYELLKETASRASFEIYDFDYYKNLYQTLKKYNLVELLLAKYQGKIVGGAMAIFFGDEVTYSHSAADPEKRDLAVAYPILWEIIKIAKERGCKKLDLWGVAPESEINHPWAGFTHFKRGFAPRESIHAYPGSYFMILKPFKFRLYLWQKVLRGRKI